MNKDRCPICGRHAPLALAEISKLISLPLCKRKLCSQIALRSMKFWESFFILFPHIPVLAWGLQWLPSWAARTPDELYLYQALATKQRFFDSRWR